MLACLLACRVMTFTHHSRGTGQGQGSLPYMVSYRSPAWHAICLAVSFACYCHCRPGLGLMCRGLGHVHGTGEVPCLHPHTHPSPPVQVSASGSTVGAFIASSAQAPELVSGQRVTQAIDIYSFGVLLYEVVTGGRAPLSRRMLCVLCACPLEAAEPATRSLLPALPCPST